MRSLVLAWRRRWWRRDPAALAAFEGLRPVTIVTGGSEGIGFELARRFASAGSDVMLVARRLEPLEQAAVQIRAETKADVSVLPLDVTVPDAAAQIEAALASRLDVDGYLRFLALDNVMVSADSFHFRVADYSLYRHPDGRFHFVFHDTNEMFSMAGGGRGGGGLQFSPLVSANDPTKPIISKILAVPSLRARYLDFVHEITTKSLDWTVLGPVVKSYRDLIEADVARDTRKLFTTDDFLRVTADDGSPGTLRGFVEGRRAFLLEWIAANSAKAVAR